MELTTKICIKCDIEKSLDEFYSKKSNKDGKHRKCKLCVKEESKTYNENNKEKITEQRKINYCKNAINAKKSRHKYYNKNKDSILKQKKEYYELNKNEIKEKAKAHYHNNTEKAKNRNKIYREKNRDELLAKKRQYNKTYIAKLSSINSKHKRKSIIKQGNVTTQQLKDLYQNTTNCYWCNNKFIDNNIHLDHYVPLSKGGQHTISNLVLSCPACNMQKYNKDPIEFALEKGKLF